MDCLSYWKGNVMPNKPELREWVSYDSIWLVIGLILLILLLAWYGFVFFITRRRKQRTLETLKPKPYIPPDLTNLKAKYQALITEVEQKYTGKELSARQVHQKLSYLLRMFVFEARGHRVDTLTLDDLKKTRYDELTKAIEQFYVPEFAAVQRGDVPSALELARKVVAEWN